MAKREKLFSKVMMILFLLMIVIGFTVPGFMNNSNPSQQNQGRVCQGDAECYLMCNDIPQAALCFQNLCQQNACEEKSYYPFTETNSSTFTFEISIEGEKLNLEERQNPLDFFISFNEDEVTLNSLNLNLNHVLDKLLTTIDPPCLFIGEESYCVTSDSELVMTVNGEQSYSYGRYTPQDGDIIKIVYG